MQWSKDSDIEIHMHLEYWLIFSLCLQLYCFCSMQLIIWSTILPPRSVYCPWSIQLCGHKPAAWKGCHASTHDVIPALPIGVILAHFPAWTSCGVAPFIRGNCLLGLIAAAHFATSANQLVVGLSTQLAPPNI